MEANRIVIDSMPSIKIMECEIRKEVNAHFSAEIRGYLSDKDKSSAEYVQMERIHVVAMNERDEQQSIFRGLITSMSVTSDGNFNKISIFAESYTRAMDLEEGFRVFQDRGMTYRDIAAYIVSCHEQAAAIYHRGARVAADGIAVQYKETDWEFLKRIASNINMFLVADCKNEKASFFFGPPVRTEVNDLSCASVQIRWMLEEGRRIQEYEVESGDLLNLLDKVIVQDIPMHVFAVRTRIIDGEILNLYRLRSLKDFYVNKYYNGKIAGVSLTGRVERVEDTRVQVDFDGSAVDDKGGRRWLEFATVYSSSGGAGWYCMPEVGDKVRVYFPDEDETDAYAASAIHTDAGSHLRTNPDEKFIRTIYDKEIKLTPTRIVLTNHRGMEIILDDERGIMMKSKKDIEIASSGTLNMESGDGIEIQSDTGVYLRQKGNMLMVRDGICEEGMNIELR